MSFEFQVSGSEFGKLVIDNKIAIGSREIAVGSREIAVGSRAKQFDF
jgi:hypothetical protein